MPADRTKDHHTITPPPIHASPIKIPSTSPGNQSNLKHGNNTPAIANAKGHGRARSSSGSSQASASRTVPPFPTLLATSETVLEQNSFDILWKTFVAFEQDMRDCSNLAPLLPGIEATVASAIDPISLAGDCLAETANYIETEIREAIEETLASGGTLLSSSSPGSSVSEGGTRCILSSPVSHSKQFSLASSRLSGACSTFRATQASLRYYGGARKTAYQLDLFVHKYALPTSTALHKRGQEFSAANKWLKKMLNGDGRMLDALEIAALRRAANSLRHWAEGLRIHADLLKNAANGVRSLMQERASLQIYSFPARSFGMQEQQRSPVSLTAAAPPPPPPSTSHGLQGHAPYTQSGLSATMGMVGSSPLSQWTNIASMPQSASNMPLTTSPALQPGSVNMFDMSTYSPSTATISSLATPENSFQPRMLPQTLPNIMPQSLHTPHTQSQLPSTLPSQTLPQSPSIPLSLTNALPQSYTPSLPTSLPQNLPQSLPQTCAFAFSTPTYVQDQSVFQQSQQQYQLQQQHQPTFGSLGSPPLHSPDLSFPTELFFDNLCM